MAAPDGDSPTQAAPFEREAGEPARTGSHAACRSLCVAAVLWPGGCLREAGPGRSHGAPGNGCRAASGPGWQAARGRGLAPSGARRLPEGVGNEQLSVRHVTPNLPHFKADL